MVAELTLLFSHSNHLSRFKPSSDCCSPLFLHFLNLRLLTLKRLGKLLDYIVGCSFHLSASCDSPLPYAKCFTVVY